MFDAMKNLANLPGIMARAREFQEKVKSMRDELSARQVSADSGAGAVTAIVNGRLELVGLSIDKTRVDPNDTEMLQDLILAAVNAAHTKAADMMQQEMSRRATGMGLPTGMLG